MSLQNFKSLTKEISNMFSQKRKWELIDVPKRPASNGATVYTEVEKHWALGGRQVAPLFRREGGPSTG